MREILAREIGFLRDDVASVRKIATPRRRAALAIVIGVVAVVVGLSEWSRPLAVIVAGLVFVAYGFLFVDVDAAPEVNRPRRRAQ